MKIYFKLLVKKFPKIVACILTELLQKTIQEQTKLVLTPSLQTECC